VRPPVRKAVIPAAGLGTRFLPATKAQPKEMLPLVDKPAIQYVVEEAVQAGLRDILIITGRGKRSLEDHFDRSFELEHYLEVGGKHDQLKQVRAIAEMADIHYVRQGEPRGLGHAVAVAADHVGDDRVKPGRGGDVQLTDAMALLLEDQEIFGFVFDDVRYDIGQKLDYLRATVEIAIEREDLGPAFRAFLSDLVQRKKLV
jgi:UTP--glucose-1-phosphate uridylyltransferase